MDIHSSFLDSKTMNITSFILADPSMLVLLFLILCLLISSPGGFLYKIHYSFMSLLIIRGLELLQNPSKFPLILFFVTYFVFIDMFYARNTVPATRIWLVMIYNLVIFITMCYFYNWKYVVYFPLLGIVYVILRIWSRVAAIIRRIAGENFKKEKKKKEEEEKKKKEGDK